MHDNERTTPSDPVEPSPPARSIEREFSELELVYQYAPVGLCVLDPELRFVRINHRLAEINGIPASEHIGRSIQDVLPACAAPLEQVAAQVLSTGKPVLDFEFSSETPAEPGRTRYFSESWYPAFDEGGEIAAIGVVVDEITDKKEREQQLAESEERFRLALSSGAVTVYEQDTDLRYRWLYPTEPYSPGAIGRTDSEISPGPGAEYIEHLKRSVIETGRPIRETVGVPLRKDTRWYDLSIEPRFGADGDVTGVGGTALDVTDRVRAEKANRESEELLQIATETALMFGWDVDFGAGTVKWSPNASKIIGRPERELPARATEANFFVHQDDKKDLYEKYLDALQRGLEQYSVEFRGSNRAGEIRNWLSICRIIRDASGNGSRIIGVTQDITERKRVEDELRRNEIFNSQLIANSPDCLKTLDLEGNLMSMSPSGIELLELDRVDPFLGRPYEQFWRDADRPGVRSAVSDAKRGRSGRFQAFCPSASGKPMWWDVIIRPIYGPDGRLEKLLSVSRDITDQKQAELDQAALFRVSEMIRSATDADALLGDVVDLVGKYLEVSRCVFLELQPGNGSALAHRDFHREGQPPLAGQMPLGQFSPESIELLRSGQTLVNDDVKNNPRTSRFYEPAYRALAMEAFVGVPLFHDGRWVSILAVVQDAPRAWAPSEIGFIESVAERTWLAVERLRSEAALKETAERFRLALSSGSVFVYAQDRDLRYRWVYPAPTTRESIVGLTDRELFGGPEAEVRETIKRRVIETGVSERHELPVVVNGAQRWYDLTVEPHRDGDRGVIGVIGTALDITERRNAEAEARRLATIVEATTDFVAVGTLDGQVLYLNPAGRRLLDIGEEEELTHLRHQELCPQWVMERTVNEWMPIAEKEGSATGEGALLTREGEEIPVSFVMNLHKNESGETVFVSTISRDIRREKQLAADRERLFQLEQEARTTAENANRARDEFLAVLSHELRTPLHSMKGWLSMIRRGELDDATREKAMGAIHRGVETQAALIEDLLDISRIVSRRLQIEQNSISPILAVRNVFDQMRPAAEQKGIEMTLSVDAEDRMMVGDQVRLEQILSNLLNNAIKFTPENGRVSVGVENVENQIEITVADTGDGIGPENLSRIFERFEQQDSSSRRPFGGLGLGLTIARHLTELHGGTLTAQSGGKATGSTFILRLPLVSGVEAAATEMTGTGEANGIGSKPLEHVSVLLLEDDAEALEMMCSFLTVAGANVIGRSDVGAALELLRSGRFDVLIADIGMPRLNGHDFIRAVRRDLKLKESVLPAIAVSGFAAKADKEESLANGYQIHFAKPLDPADLIPALRSLLGNVKRKGFRRPTSDGKN